MKKHTWRTALGFSLTLHVLFFFTAIRLASSQSVAEPIPIEVELDMPADATPQANLAKRADASPKTSPLRPDQQLSRAETSTREAQQPVSTVALPAAQARETEKIAPKADPAAPATVALAAPAGSHDGATAPRPAPALPPAGSGNGGVARAFALSAAAPPAGFASGKATGATANAAGVLPYVIKGPPPAYPREARSKGWTGKVRVRVLISEQGTVKDAAIALSSGHASLDDAARLGLYRWLFKPAYQDGRAVTAWVVVPVLFKLE
jgi:periplasmic protein TonB